MAEVYVTLGEAAELERVKYNTMVKRVLRKQESFVTKTEKSENGGKDVVLVAVSSLSKQARNAWKEREKVSNRLVKAVRAKALDELQVEVDPGDIETSITNIQEQLNTPVEDAVRDKVISSGSVSMVTLSSVVK